MTLTGRTIPIESCTSPALRAGLAYWESARGDKAMPARADILPERIPHILPRCMMIRVEYDPYDLRLSVFGGDHAEAAGQDFTGYSVRAIRPPALADLAWDQYSEAIEAARPVAHRMETRSQRRSSRCQRISLPLSEDGRTVDRLLVVSDTPREFWEVLREQGAAIPG